MQKYIAVAFLVSASLTAQMSCASTSVDKADKTVSTKTVKVKDFNKIEAASGIQVTYTQGAHTPVKVTCPRYILDYVEVDVDGGTLELSIGKEYWDNYENLKGDQVKVAVSASGLASIEVSSGASCSIPKGLKTDDLDIDLSSGASVKISEGLKASRLSIEASSGASISVTKLTADDLICDLSSGSSVSIDDAHTEHSEFDLSSGASCRIEGSADSLEVDASSGAQFNGAKFRSRTAVVDASSAASINYNSKDGKDDSDGSRSGSSVTNHY